MFGIEFLDDTGAQQTAWTTSWGVSTRMVGGLIMAHGDDDGLRVPPRLAPIQVVVLAVRDEGDVVARCGAVADELRAAGVRVQLDDARRRVARPPRHRLGAQGRARARSSSVRATSPTAWPRSCAASPAGEERKSAVALDGVVDAVVAELDRQQARAARRGDRAARRRAPST